MLNKKYSISSAFILVYKPTFFLIIVAILVSNSNNLYPILTASNTYIALSLMTLGILLGVSSGVAIESKLRNYFSEVWIKGLSIFKETKDIEQIIQLCSRDLTTIFERLSWYIHDILWVLSMLLVSLVAMFFSFGFVGVLLSTVFISIFFILYKCTIKEIVRTRKESVNGFNSLIMSSYNSIRVKKMNFIDQNVINSIYSKSVNTPLHYFHDSRKNMIKSKSLAGINCATLGDLVILSCAFTGALMEVPIQSLLVVATPLILIKSSLINVFFAITGFQSNSISAYRISEFSAAKEKVEMKYSNGIFYIPSFSNFIDYHELILEEGRIYQLSAPSGAGKTTYLKSIGNIINAEKSNNKIKTDSEVKAYSIYLNEKYKYYLFENSNIQDFVKDVASNIINKPILISLDECLLDLEVPDAKNLLSNIIDSIKNKSIAVIFSDHRFNFGEKIIWETMTSNE